MRISGALAQARSLKVPFEGEELNISYRPSSYSVEELEKLVSDEESGAKKIEPSRIIDIIQQMVITWDLTEDNGEPIHLSDRQRLKQLPTSIYTVILQTVKADQSVGEAERPSDAS